MLRNERDAGVGEAWVVYLKLFVKSRLDGEGGGRVLFQASEHPTL